MASVVLVIRPGWADGFEVVGAGVDVEVVCGSGRFDLACSGRPVVVVLAATVVALVNLTIWLSPLISCNLSRLFSWPHSSLLVLHCCLVSVESCKFMLDCCTCLGVF